MTVVEDSKAAKNPEASSDASGVFDSDGSEQQESTEASAGETDSDGDRVVPADTSSKAEEGTPEDLIDRLQNIGDGEEAGETVASDEEEGGNRGIPGAGGIGIILPASSAKILAASSGAAIVHALVFVILCN